MAKLPELTRRSIEIGGISILLHLPASSDAVLNHSLSGQSENPYWGVLWDAAIPMARYVASKDWGHQQNCLELGCGLGLTGIAAWKSGLPVLMTDIVPEAVELAHRNASLNGLAQCHSSVLDWNQDSTVRYSTIIACDVLYDRSQHASLLRFLESASTPETEIYLGDPGRLSSLQFVVDAEAAGFNVETIDEHGRTVEPQTAQFRVFVLRQGA